jgi:DNA-binding transcriptional MocR family regulator
VVTDAWDTWIERWRSALGDGPWGPGSDGLVRVIRDEIERGVLASGAVLPPPERVARLLGVEVREVRAAYGVLGLTGLIVERTHGMAVVGAAAASEPRRRS